MGVSGVSNNVPTYNNTNTAGTSGTTGSANSTNTVGASNTGSGSTSGTNTASAASQQTNFLKLLSAQLQYQDPLQPEQNTDFSAQMAQFSALSEQQTTNSLLQQLISAKSTDQLGQAVSYIGKQVSVTGNGASVQGGAGSVQFKLPQSATAQVSVFDTTGRVVKQIPAQAYDSGDNTVNLNDPKFGAKLPDGQYTYAVQVNGNASVQATLMQTGVVTGVSQQGSGIVLDLNGQSVPVGNVVRIQQQPGS
ncbi:MAG: hypothetical protein HQL66_07420 [Magnetococcales bacterium]|nr:hypothetical protein [Magnetococcales bacterium]